MKLDSVLRRPVALTEKANLLRQKGNQVVFEVVREANKSEIKQAVETLFGVKVLSVNTMLYRGKDRRMGRGYAKLHNWKKAVVTLKEGDSIDFFAESAADAVTAKK